MIVPVFATFALPVLALTAAVAAASLPVLIHLLSQQRHQVVPWAAMRFLMAAQKRHRRQIDRWLLLVLSMLGLLLLLRGLCAPMPWAERAWQAVRPGQLETMSNAPRTHHILVLDATLSMSTASDNSTRFQLAVEQLERLIRNANPGDGFSLFVVGGDTQAVVPGPASDPDKVALELFNIKPTHGNGDYANVLPLIADTLARSPRSYPRREVTWMCDLQRAAFNPVLERADNPAPEVWQRILSRADVAIIDLAGSDYNNLAVTGLELGDPLPLVDVPKLCWPRSTTTAIPTRTP